MNNKMPDAAEMEKILQSLRACRSQQKKGGVEERKESQGKRQEMAISDEGVATPDERTIKNSFIYIEPVPWTITMVFPNPENCDKDDKVYFK